MASSKNKDNIFFRLRCAKQPDMDVINLRNENACLKKTLEELSRQTKEALDCENKLLERILSLETIREKNSQQLMAKDEEIASLWKQLSVKGGGQIDFYVEEKEKERHEERIHFLQTETEEVKNKLATITARCQYLESRDAGQQDCSSDAVTVLNNHLTDALEKNRQWLAYDQKREAYVRAILDRMSWLEQQLNEANQALSQQHNEDHSDEREKIIQMQEHYDNMLFQAKKQLEVLREQADTARHDQSDMQWRCEEMEREVDELKQQLQTERLSRRTSAQEEKDFSGNRERRLRAEAKDLEGRLDEEKRRSAELLLQVNLLQKSMLNHDEDQKKITILEQQIQVLSQDLEDERRDCLYLQKQLYKVLKELRRSKGNMAKLSKRDQQDPSSYEASSDNRHPPTKPPRVSVTSPPRISLLDESLQECPGCRAQYPTSQYRELLAHLDHCLD
ncbi:centrosomal protein of 55 kDa-like [Centroberyx affinis]|uniref:centrosomal protein of 55 kDa-like n=1 Tax=Centroberyx affinis TaxID=166261 RepID=UPI003A5C6415